LEAGEAPLERLELLLGVKVLAVLGGRSAELDAATNTLGCGIYMGPVCGGMSSSEPLLSSGPGPKSPAP
jgi:hypothetical protein